MAFLFQWQLDLWNNDIKNVLYFNKTQYWGILSSCSRVKAVSSHLTLGAWFPHHLLANFSPGIGVLCHSSLNCSIVFIPWACPGNTNQPPSPAPQSSRTEHPYMYRARSTLSVPTPFPSRFFSFWKSITQPMRANFKRYVYQITQNVVTLLNIWKI